MLSRYNKLGVYRRGWLRSILFDRTSILFVEQAVHRILVHFPILLVRCKTWFGQIKLYWILVILMHGIHGLEFCPFAINPEFVMECKLTAHPIW